MSASTTGCEKSLLSRQSAVVPLPKKFVGGFDADGLGLLLGVEPQVEEVLQRFEQCRLPDRMPGDVGESDCGP